MGRDFCRTESRLGKADKEVEQRCCSRLLGAGGGTVGRGLGSRPASLRELLFPRGRKVGKRVRQARSFGTVRDLQVILDLCDPQGGAAGKALYLGLEDAKPALLVAAGPFLLPARTPQREGGWG